MHLQDSDWSTKLQDFYLINKNGTSLEVNLIFGVSIENGIAFNKAGTNWIENIRIEIFGKMIDDKLSINPTQLSIHWDEI